MKKLLLTITWAALASHAVGYGKTSKFKVKVQNLTKGQPLTPVLLAVHEKRSAPIFTVGQEASFGLAELSKDGVIDVLKEELSEEKKKVEAIVTGDGVILPGKTQELIFESSQRNPTISLVSMLARTNDAFIGLSKIKLRVSSREELTMLASVYDAGVEENTESCAHIPAPPCDNPGITTLNSEGFIRPHEGITGAGDLVRARDQFSSKAAKVTITRIK